MLEVGDENNRRSRVWRQRVISVVCVACAMLFYEVKLLAAENELMTFDEKPLPSEDLKVGPYTSAGLDRAGLQRAVLEAMSRVPRHQFVPRNEQDQAYDDRALPIGSGQTISQPYIVALMTQAAHITRGSRVLEIGTGSGYQAAVLSELGAKVFSVEIVPELAAEARLRLQTLGYPNIELRQGDGWLGWPEAAPFDAIIVTAASPQIPQKLLLQLTEQGRLVIPIERNTEEAERLTVFQRNATDIIVEDLGAVKFVPLTGIARNSEFEASPFPLLEEQFRRSVSSNQPKEDERE